MILKELTYERAFIQCSTRWDYPSATLPLQWMHVWRSSKIRYLLLLFCSMGLGRKSQFHVCNQTGPHPVMSLHIRKLIWQYA